jgi:hypothetical protein
MTLVTEAMPVVRSAVPTTCNPLSRVTALVTRLVLPPGVPFTSFSSYFRPGTRATVNRSM